MLVFFIQNTSRVYNKNKWILLGTQFHYNLVCASFYSSNIHVRTKASTTEYGSQLDAGLLSSK